MPNKIKKQKCYGGHSQDRDLNEYTFWVTDIRKKNHVDIYECKKCKEQLERDIDRQNRIKAHNNKQQEDAYNRFKIKMDKKIFRLEKSKKEGLWDCVIKNELTKGLKLTGHNKYLYQQKITKDIIQLKRATINLKTLISKIKENKNDKNNKYQRT